MFILYSTEMRGEAYHRQKWDAMKRLGFIWICPILSLIRTEHTGDLSMTFNKNNDLIGNILDALRKAESGDYSTNIDPASENGDLKLIIDAVNKLLSKTEKRITAMETFIEDLTADAGRYRNIIDSIEESYFEVDLKGKLQFFNERVCLDLGYSEKELQEMHFFQLTDEGKRAKTL